MSKLILPAVALFALTFVSFSADTADAKGVHFRAGGLHVDVGNPHRSYYGGYGGGCATNYPSYGYGGGWGWGGGHSWHDTSHWDYHPTEYRWHGNHWDVQPGHYDWHQQGHLDHHHP